MRRLPLILLLFLIPMAGPFLYGQSSKDLIRRGNKLYDEKKYSDAEIEYMKSLEKEGKYPKGMFNLGDALYKQENYEDAAEKFIELSGRELDDETLANVYHNLGNSYLKANKFEESIEAYKNALRNNPKDMDTKYNLEYARKKLIQQQQQQQDKNKDDKNKDKKDQEKNKDKNKDDKNENKDQEKNQDQKKDDKQQQQNQEQQQDEKKQQESRQQKESEQKMDPKDANRILQALKKEEKKLLKKLRKQKRKKGQIEKNW